MVWALFASYLLFGFGGAVIAACCPDAPGGYPARRALCFQEEGCASGEVLHQATPVQAPKEACLDHCSPGRHSRLHLTAGQAFNHAGDLPGIVGSARTSFPQRPLPVGFSAYQLQDNVPQLALIVLRTVVLLV